MGMVVIESNSVRELNPGETFRGHWNNAAPAKAVWSANAVPLTTGTTNTGFSQDTSLEVTRLWRRLVVIENSQSQFSDTDLEHEIHYEVKNVGPEKAKFRMYFCAQW